MTFKEIQLQEILDIQWGDTKTTKASYVSEGYLAYSAKGPDGFLDKYDYDKEGIVLSAIGANCGSTFYASGKWSCIKNTIRIFPKNDAVDLKYFFYMTKAPDFWPIRGSAQPFISQTDIRELYVQIPELRVQEMIGKMLFELDEKITANNALSKTLEDIAQAIFKSWFIDFDPVREKLAGMKPTDMDAATAALFPDSMEESEIGIIPKNWRWGTIGDIADVIDCLHAKKPELIQQGKPYLQLDTISDEGVLRFENAAKISEADYKKWTSRIEVAGGDCLITNVGRVGAVSQVPDHFMGAIGRNITAIRPRNLKRYKSYLINVLLSDFMKAEIRRNTDSGTILEALNVKNIPKLRVPLASDELMDAYEEICAPIWSQVNTLHQQTVQLRLIRDALLPRLISGKLQIPEEMLAS